MNRKLWVVGLFVTATVLLGCQGREGDLPSAPRDDLSPAAINPPTYENIKAAIEDCTTGGTRKSFLKRLRDINNKVVRGQLGVAQDMADLFIEDFLEAFYEGRAGFNCDATETGDIIVALLAFVQTPLSAEDQANLEAALAAGDRGAAQICDLSAGCTVVPENTCRGISIPPQTTNTGNHLVFVFPIDANPFVGVFPGYNSYPLWADVSASGVTEFDPAAIVGVFVVETGPGAPPNATVEARLRMGHKIFDSVDDQFEVELLTLVDPPFIGCEGGDVASLEGGWQGWLAMSPLGRLFQVTPLYANPGKLGGALISGSPIGAVDPDSDTETTLTLDVTTLADGEDVTATADVEVVTLGQPPLLSESPTVDFVVDEDTEDEQTFPDEPLASNGEATLVLTCDTGDGGPILTGLALAQATGTVGPGSHTIIARYDGTDSSAPSESTVETVECGGFPEGFSDGFESGLSWTATGFWNRTTGAGITNTLVGSGHVSLAPDDVSGGALPSAPEGSWYAWYGEAEDGNFIGTQAAEDADGSGGTSTTPNSGSLTSPAFLVPTGFSNPLLTFEAWYEIEAIAPSGFDQMVVSIIDVEAATITELGRLNPASNPSSAASDQPFTSTGFNQAPTFFTASFSLSGFEGLAVQIVLTFATGDFLYNGFRGWIVDDVEVVDGGPVPESLAPASSPTSSLYANRAACSEPVCLEFPLRSRP